MLVNIFKIAYSSQGCLNKLDFCANFRKNNSDYFVYYYTFLKLET